MIHRYLGIDPGLTGAFALLTIHPDKEKEIWLSEFPTIENEPDWQQVKMYFAGMQDAIVTLEKVNAMPKQGVSSMFKFGRIYGGLQASIAMFGLTCMEVTPQQWQKELFEGVPKMDDPKAMARIAVQRLFPNVNLIKSDRSKKPHEGYVDALLLAEYGRRKLTKIFPGT